MEKVITGNEAVAHAVRLARAQVIAAYPITPQTSVVEKLAAFCADGELDAQFIKVESELSSMAACIGASSAGARAFTATSSQGLLLMHELLFWASGARLPIVLAEVNRAVGAPWSIWGEQTDSLAQRDTGWLQFYCESGQEVLDTVLQAYHVAEAVSLPTMVIQDAFILSHPAEIVDGPDQERVDEFLPPYRPQYKLDVDDPRTLGGPANENLYMEFRYKMHQSAEEAKSAVLDTGAEFERLFGRRHGLVEPYRLDGAEVVMIAAGSGCGTARVVVDALRDEGRPVGLLRLRLFRPFPTEAVRQALAGVPKVAVLDQSISFGHEGIFAQELRSALYGLSPSPAVFGFVAGLGGRDLTPAVLREIFDHALAHEWPEGDVIWMGVR